MCASSHLCELRVSLFSSPLINLNVFLLTAKIIYRRNIKARPRVEDETILGHGL
jgi:hypothetical protein